MSRTKIVPSAPFRFRIGAGTLIGAVIAAICAAQFISRPPVALAASHHAPVSLPRIVKPEPSWLFDCRQLHLGREQGSRIAGIAELWREERQIFSREIAELARTAEAHSGTADFQECARLSGSYETTRQEAWNRCLIVLSPTQRAIATSLTGPYSERA